MRRFSPEYRRHVSRRSPSWTVRRQLTLWLFLGRDALLPILPAHHADHLHYRSLGWELPVLDILPYHRTTHRLIGLLRKVFGRFLVNLVLRAAAIGWLVLGVAVLLKVIWAF